MAIDLGPSPRRVHLLAVEPFVRSMGERAVGVAAVSGCGSVGRPFKGMVGDIILMFTRLHL